METSPGTQEGARPEAASHARKTACNRHALRDDRPALRAPDAATRHSDELPSWKPRCGRLWATKTRSPGADGACGHQAGAIIRAGGARNACSRDGGSRLVFVPLAASTLPRRRWSLGTSVRVASSLDPKERLTAWLRELQAGKSGVTVVGGAGGSENQTAVLDYVTEAARRAE
jgi:hypothetical protein